ncbi:MAG: glutathione S-transferase family protein [Alphaproteobacteria bacterium]
MSKLTIYGTPQARPYRTYWMARELGLDYEAKPWSFRGEELKSDAYKEINPNVRIPAIDDDGFKLWESMAINLYLARKHGGPLQPADLQGEAQAMMWSFWVMTEIEKPVLAYLFQMMGPEDKRDPAVMETSLDELKRPLAVLDDHLAKSPYILGGDFTVADLNVAAVLSWAKMSKIDLSAWPKVKDWLDRCLGRPAAKAAREG